MQPAVRATVERGRLRDYSDAPRELLSDLWPLKRQVDAKARRGTPDSAGVDATTTDPSRASEASELVARGWMYLRSGSFFEVSHAVSAFVAATTIDPTHAAAYAGLALAKLGQATDRNVLVEAYGEAKAAALRAVALDDKSADAQVALGHVMFTAEWDWIAAERSFQRALAINPNHAEAYIYYGILMEALGDLERGLSLKMQGLECDSTSVLAHLWIAVSFWNQRRYDDVIVWANKALDRDPQHPFARELLVGAHWKMGNLERAGELPPHGAAQPELEWLLVLHYAETGDLDAAFEQLQRLIDARDPALIHLAVAPQWDSLRADPRFNECLARMHLRPVGTVSGPMPESH